MSLGFSDMTPEGRRYFRELQKLAEIEIHVGYQADQSYEDGTGLAEVAAYNEFGTSNTPARPFMRQSFENHESKLQAACDMANRTLSGGGTAELAISQIGTNAVGLIQDEMIDGGFAPNAESTIRRKGSEQPLADTGTLFQSVKYVVKRRGS